MRICEMMNDLMDCKRVYSADGVKLKARHITAIPQGTGSSSSSTNYIMSKDSTDYIGDFIYHNNKFSKYNWGNGYIVPTGSSSGYAYRFYFKDHQGNNRVVTTNTGTVKQTTHYYPDGVTHDRSRDCRDTNTMARNLIGCTGWTGMTTVPGSTTPPSDNSSAWIRCARNTTMSVLMCIVIPTPS